MESKIFIEKLNNSNYYTWKYKIRLLLIKEDVWECITENAPDYVEDSRVANRAIQRWTKKDQKAQAIIGLNVEDAQLVYIRGKDTAAEIWNALKFVHEKDTLTNRVSIYKKIAMLKMKESDKIENHLNEMVGLFQKLEDLGQESDEQWKIGMVFASLPPSYSTLVTALEARKDEDLTWALVQSKIIDEDLRQQEIRQTKKEEDYVDQQKLYNIATAKNQQIVTTKNQKMHCYFCKRDNHFMKDCMKFKRYNEFNEFMELQKEKEKEKINEVKEDSLSEEEGNEFLLTIQSENDGSQIVNSKFAMREKRMIRNKILSLKIDHVNVEKQLKAINELTALFERLSKLEDDISDDWKSTILLNKVEQFFEDIQVDDQLEWKSVKRKIIKKLKRRRKIAESKHFQMELI